MGEPRSLLELIPKVRGRQEDFLTEKLRKTANLLILEEKRIAKLKENEPIGGNVNEIRIYSC